MCVCVCVCVCVCFANHYRLQSEHATSFVMYPMNVCVCVCVCIQLAAQRAAEKQEVVERGRATLDKRLVEMGLDKTDLKRDVMG